MTHPIITIDNAFPDIAFIEIFKPYLLNKNTFYPVKIDGIEITLKKNDSYKWVTKETTFNDEIIQYVGSRIEHHGL
jgi:hypothetical protein